MSGPPKNTPLLEKTLEEYQENTPLIEIALREYHENGISNDNKEFVLAVVGGRDFNDYNLMCEKLDEITQTFMVTKMVSGGAKGADSLARKYAHSRNIPIKEYMPDWSKGKHAGFTRNTDIVNKCNTLVAFWDKKSNGTKDSIAKARKSDKLLEIVYY